MNFGFGELYWQDDRSNNERGTTAPPSKQLKPKYYCKYMLFFSHRGAIKLTHSRPFHLSLNDGYFI